ncbi:HET-domain-containing protein, partial [Parathielavia appendiculata]
YVAMSYAWGRPPQPMVEILVNGNRMMVGKNLEAGFRRFRAMDYFRLGGKLWADAVCINQRDLAEKQEQVPLMASIYRHAGNVIVWLGPEADDSDQVISLLESLGTTYRAEYYELLDAEDALDVEDSALHTMAEKLYHFFDRPYWRRVWIIQEICMGRGGMPIVCGQRVTQWRHIRDGLLRLTSMLDILEHAMWEVLGSRIQPLEHSLLHVAQIAQLEITAIDAAWLRCRPTSSPWWFPPSSRKAHCWAAPSAERLFSPRRRCSQCPTTKSTACSASPACLI